MSLLDIFHQGPVDQPDAEEAAFKRGREFGRQEGAVLHQEQHKRDEQQLALHLFLDTVQTITTDLTKEEYEDLSDLLHQEEFKTMRTWLLKQAQGFSDRSASAPEKDCYVLTRFAHLLREIVFHLDRLKRPEQETPQPQDPYAP